MNIFIDTEDMEERYAEGLYKDYLEEQNKQLQQENEKLKDNWNKLKEYVNEVGSPFVDGWGYVQIEDKIVYVDDILEEMQELEEGKDND